MCRADESANATENAVAALGKALQHMQNLPDTSGVAELWVQSLPLTVDADEAKIAHKQLVGYIQSSDQRYAITCLPCHALTQLLFVVASVIQACHMACTAAGHDSRLVYHTSNLDQHKVQTHALGSAWQSF